MAIEIERKFLVSNDNWRQHTTSSLRMVQGYLGGNANSSIRIRVCGEVADINIKARVIGVQRNEYEYMIPVTEAEEMLQLCDKPLIEKTRHQLSHAGHTWEIDEFCGENEGLIVAELELGAVNEQFERPDWLGKEVTEDVRYYNICLVENPYRSWQQGH